MSVRCSYSARITLAILEQDQYCSDSVLKQTRRWASLWEAVGGVEDFCEAF